MDTRLRDTGRGTLDNVVLRDASIADAAFIARVVLAGIDMLDMGEDLPDEQ